MVALLIGFIFYGQKLDEKGVMNINGALFLFLTNMTFQNVFSVINVSFKRGWKIRILKPQNNF